MDLLRAKAASREAIHSSRRFRARQTRVGIGYVNRRSPALQWRALRIHVEKHEMAARRKTIPGVRALIFDLDGTLIDSKLDLALAVNAALEEMGRQPLPHEQIYGYVGQGAPM